MFEIRLSTIEPMLNIIERFNNGIEIKDDLSTLLDHEDYKIEIERYNVHQAKIGFSKEEYINFFINIRNIDKDKISSKALKYRVDDLLYIMDNVNHFKRLLKSLENFDYSEAQKKSEYGLPDNIDLGKVIIIFSIGLGVSGGWAYGNYTHYDLRAVIDKKTEQGLINVIAHECHHVGHSKIPRMKSISPEAELIYYLSVEGTAVKFCNNFEGIFTSKIYPNEEMSMAQISYNYYKNNFEEIYKQFKNDIRSLAMRKAVSYDLYIENYSYRDVTVDGKLIENYLSQPLKYQLGADIWGLVYDVFGRKVVGQCLENPELFLGFFNRALEEKNLFKYKI